MSKRRFSTATLTLIALLAGCNSSNPPPPRQQTAKAAYAYPADTTTGTAGNNTDRPIITEPKPTPSELAQQAQEYAQHVEPLLAKRAASNAQTASARTGAAAADPANGGAAPSAVRFLDPARAPKGTPDAAAHLPDPFAHPSGTEPADPRTQVASITPPVPAAPPTVTQQTPPTVTQTPPRPDVTFNKDTPALNTPLIVAQPRPLPASDDLAQKFAKQVKDFPQDVAAQLDWQLLQFVQGQSVPQLQSLSTLSSEDREMMSAVLDGLTNFRNVLRSDNNMLLSRKIRPMIELSDQLRTQAELTVPTIALCTDVKGFGVYEPIEPARFEAGKEHKVIVYCEVENFASTLDEQKRWETKLTQEVVMYTEQNGLEVWRDKGPVRPIIDYSRNRRHDFFIVKMIRLPANLTIGRYLVKVSVVDQQVNRVAENTVAVQIVAQP